MPRFLPRTFFAQLVLSTVLVQTLFLSVFTIYVVSSQNRQSQQRLRERSLQQLERLAVACEKPLTFHDIGALHDVLQLSLISPSIQAARLTDLSGNTLAVTDLGKDRDLDSFERSVVKDAAKQQIFGLRDGEIEAVTPVKLNGHPAALLWMEPNPSVAADNIKTVVRIALTYGGFALLANLLPIFLIVRSMTRPLRTLNNATQHVIRDADGPAAFPLPVRSSNEAGALTLSFNKMVQELEEQRSGLLETLALLDSLLGNAPIGFAFFDRELRHVRVNPFLADVYGAPAEQSLGLRASELYPGSLATGMETSIRSVFTTGAAIRDVELSGPIPHQPSSKRTWLMHFYPVRPQQDEVRWVGVIVVEITERLQAEETLRKTEKLAATGRLAASVAHEINNPLEAVTNLLYLLQMHRPMDAEAMNYITTAQGEVARMSDITQQTLRFHRQIASPANTSIAEIMRSITTLYQTRIISAGVTIVSRFRGRPELVCFSGEIRQLTANLIMNAVDAMSRGGRLFLRAQSGSGRAGDGTWTTGVHFSVSDTGIGMSEETQAKIFEAFFTTKPATGTGLGLWVSDEIIRKHRGTMRLKSREGIGSCFRIFLPLHAATFTKGEAA